jgi:hypothetical protein
VSLRGKGREAGEHGRGAERRRQKAENGKRWKGFSTQKRRRPDKSIIAQLF